MCVRESFYRVFMVRRGKVLVELCCCGCCVVVVVLDRLLLVGMCWDSIDSQVILYERYCVAFLYPPLIFYTSRSSLYLNIGTYSVLGKWMKKMRE